MPADTVRLEGCELPLGQRRYSMDFAPGSTLADLVREAAGGAPVAVQVDGEPVPPHLWPKLRLKGGALVTVAPEAGLGFVVAAIAAFAVGAAITFLLPRPGSPEEAERAHRLEGGSNRANRGGPFPVVFGRIRFAPPLANEWIPYVAGRKATPDQAGVPGTGRWLPAPAADDNAHWIRTLLCWGLGAVDVSDIRLDRTPAADFGEAVRLATATGPNADFPHAVRRVRIGADLNGAAAVKRRIGRVEADATVNLVWPQGLYRVNDKGEIHGFDDASKASKAPVALTVELLDAAGTVLDSEAVTAQGGTTATPHHQSVTLTAPAAGECAVRVARAVAARESLQAHDDLRIDDVTVPLAAAPLALACTTTSVRIQATERISNQVPAISGVCHARIPDWDGAAWTVRPTRNPASAFRAVLAGAGNARPLAESRLAMARLREWHEWCADEGWTYDAAHLRQRGVNDVLKEIAAAGRAAPTWLDGLRGVAIDRAQAHRAQVFTPANCTGFGGSRSGRPVPHALRARYRDEDEDYARAEVRVYRPGYDADSATLVEERRLPGQTVRNTVAAQLAYQLRSELERREEYRIECDWEHLAAEQGARVGLQHDALHDRAWSGRVASFEAVEGVAGAVDVLLDIDAGLRDGVAYWAVVRPPSGHPATYAAAPAPGAFTARLSGAGEAPAVAAGDLVAIGQAGTGIEDCFVAAVEDAGDARARLTLAAYGGAAVFDAQAGYTVEHVSGGGMVSEVPFGERERGRLREPLRTRQTIHIAQRGRPAQPDGEAIPAGWTEAEQSGPVRWLSARDVAAYPLVADPAPATHVVAGLTLPVGSEIDYGPWSPVERSADPIRLVAYAITEGGLSPNKPARPAASYDIDADAWSGGVWTLWDRPAGYDRARHQLWETDTLVSASGPINRADWLAVRLTDPFNGLSFMYIRSAEPPELPPDHAAYSGNPASSGSSGGAVGAAVRRAPTPAIAVTPYGNGGIVDLLNGLPYAGGNDVTFEYDVGGGAPDFAGSGSGSTTKTIYAPQAWVRAAGGVWSAGTTVHVRAQVNGKGGDLASNYSNVASFVSVAGDPPPLPSAVRLALRGCLDGLCAALGVSDADPVLDIQRYVLRWREEVAAKSQLLVVPKLLRTTSVNIEGAAFSTYTPGAEYWSRDWVRGTGWGAWSAKQHAAGTVELGAVDGLEFDSTATGAVLDALGGDVSVYVPSIRRGRSEFRNGNLVIERAYVQNIANDLLPATLRALIPTDNQSNLSINNAGALVASIKIDNETTHNVLLTANGDTWVYTGRSVTPNAVQAWGARNAALPDGIELGTRTVDGIEPNTADVWENALVTPADFGDAAPPDFTGNKKGILRTVEGTAWGDPQNVLGSEYYIDGLTDGAEYEVLASAYTRAEGASVRAVGTAGGMEGPPMIGDITPALGHAGMDVPTPVTSEVPLTEIEVLYRLSAVPLTLHAIQATGVTARALLTAGAADKWYSREDGEDLGTAAGSLVAFSNADGQIEISRVWWKRNAANDLVLDFALAVGGPTARDWLPSPDPRTVTTTSRQSFDADRLRLTANAASDKRATLEFDDPINAAFLPAASSSVRLREVGVQAPHNNGQYRITVRTSAASSDSPFSAGPDLSDDWEAGWVMKVTVGTDEFSFDRADFAADAAEPYVFATTDATVQARLLAAFNAIVAGAAYAVEFELTTSQQVTDMATQSLYIAHGRSLVELPLRPTALSDDSATLNAGVSFSADGLAALNGVAVGDLVGLVVADIQTGSLGSGGASGSGGVARGAVDDFRPLLQKQLGDYALLDGFPADRDVDVRVVAKSKRGTTTKTTTAHRVGRNAIGLPVPEGFYATEPEGEEPLRAVLATMHDLDNGTKFCRYTDLQLLFDTVLYERFNAGARVLRGPWRFGSTYGLGHVVDIDVTVELGGAVYSGLGSYTCIKEHVADNANRPTGKANDWWELEDPPRARGDGGGGGDRPPKEDEPPKRLTEALTYDALISEVGGKDTPRLSGEWKLGSGSGKAYESSDGIIDRIIQSTVLAVAPSDAGGELQNNVWRTAAYAARQAADGAETVVARWPDGFWIRMLMSFGKRSANGERWVLSGKTVAYGGADDAPDRVTFPAREAVTLEVEADDYPIVSEVTDAALPGRVGMFAVALVDGVPGAVKATWTVTTTGGGGLRRTRAYIRPEADIGLGAVTLLPPDAVTHTFTGLSPGAYVVLVGHQNAAGVGPLERLEIIVP